MKIITLGESELAEASRRLYKHVLADGFQPTHIVVIANAGLHIARHIRPLAKGIHFITVHASRPSTEFKRKLSCTRWLWRSLPYGVTDRLRLLEYWLLVERRRQSHETMNLPSLPEESLAELASIPDAETTRVLVIDDAIDSGTTFARVLAALDRIKRSGGMVRGAVITVTRRRPLVWPDYHLYEAVLCRFPWSDDFKG